MRRGGASGRSGFHRLWAAQAVSQLGSQVSVLVLPLVAITTLRASPFEVGILSAAETLPFLLVGLPAGAWVDRAARRPVLIAADLGRALVLASIPLAAWAGRLTLAHLVGAALLTGIGTVFFDVAYQSYVPDLVGDAHLIDANAKLEVTRSAAQVVGPGFAGGLVEVLRPATAVLVDSASFAVSGVLVSAIRHRERPREPRAAGAGLRQEITEGVRHVLHHPVLARFAACTAVFNFAAGITSAAFLLYAVRELGIGAGVIGAVFSVGSIGFLIGAAFTGRVTSRFGVGPVTAAAALAQGVVFVLVPAAPARWAVGFFLVAFFLESVANPAYNINQVSLRQLLTPERLRGRTNATMRFIVWGTLPLGALLGGAIATWTSPRAALSVSAGLGVLAAAPLFTGAVLRLRTLPASAAESGDLAAS